MERDKVREIFRRLNGAGVRYVLIGGLAYSEYAPPRATQDMDLIVLVEDIPKVRDLFPGCYQRGTAIAGIYDFEGTRFDVQPAKMRLQIAAVKNAVDVTFDGEPVKLASLSDLLLLKLWSAQERTDKLKREQDQLDIKQLLSHNAGQVTALDVSSIAKDLLALAYTPEAVSEARRSIQWLNSALDQLDMSDRKYTGPL